MCICTGCVLGHLGELETGGLYVDLWGPADRYETLLRLGRKWCPSGTWSSGHHSRVESDTDESGGNSYISRTRFFLVTTLLSNFISKGDRYLLI